MKVLKFGGTSMANADSLARVKDIVRSDPAARFVVVSAPGKREKEDVKVTDLLYACHASFVATGNCDKEFDAIKVRFADIIKGLGLKLDISGHLDIIKNDILSGADVEYAASRGEYLAAIVAADYFGYDFLDAKEIIFFDENGMFDAEKTNTKAGEILLKCRRGVCIPGFYGMDTNGVIKTFSRGGSDVTGAIVARAVGAAVYENWTDVDGFMTCDPRIVDDPEIISMITYRELRELSYMGANVLHPESIFPVRKGAIPIRIRNTFNPDAEGTMIVPTNRYYKGEFKRGSSAITGIAGKKDFIGLHIEKSMMNNERGFARRALQILEDNGISLEHMPSGIDTMTLVFDGTTVSEETITAIVEEMKEKLRADRIDLVRKLALIAVVGHGMDKRKGTATQVCRALFDADINIRMIDQGSSELNIIVGVENKDYEGAIAALYNEFKK